ncbi:hypothetical protein KEM48_011330 [Puccinia striiformis f. sp. tritici PST-130]|nr:hypothetical protein KEM48_011330 [Puccinia striiformis f. sp. tritici PST-130]
MRSSIIIVVALMSLFQHAIAADVYKRDYGKYPDRPCCSTNPCNRPFVKCMADSAQASRKCPTPSSFFTLLICCDVDLRIC